MTQILSILLQSSNSARLNLTFIGCIWPTEQAFHDVNDTLQYIQRFTRLDDPSNVYVWQPSELKALMDKERVLQEVSKVNMLLKSKIDSFRRLHQKRLSDLKSKLGIEATQQQFEAIIKAKNGDREYRAAKEHKEFVEKTENINKTNKELEDKIAVMKENIEDDERNRRLIQEKFSQEYYMICRKIDNLKEDLKIASTHLKFTNSD
jgi:hypothetical protein